MDATKSLRAIAKDVLEQEDIACLIGYEKGSYGFRVQPCVLTDPAQVERLIFSPLCVHNLTNYLTLEQIGPLSKADLKEGKIAVVVKGCDSRAITVLCAENGIKREDLYVIGVHSPGVVDMKKLEARFPNVLQGDVTLDGDSFTITADGETVTVARAELANAKCLRCKSNVPLGCDVVVVLAKHVMSRLGVAFDYWPSTSAYATTWNGSGIIVIDDDRLSLRGNDLYYRFSIGFRF